MLQGTKKIRKAIGQQLRYINRNLGHIKTMLENGRQLTARQLERLEIITQVYDQQKTMYDEKSHKVSNRIVSLSQPWIRSIVRGKAGKSVEFG